jgi:hemerythrin superfamily protein
MAKRAAKKSAPRKSTRDQAKGTPRKKTADKENVLTLLKADHEAVSKLFATFERRKDSMSADQKKELAAKICTELTVHATAEEEIFYPAVANGVEDAGELVPEAKVEHESLKSLVSQIESADPDDELFDAKVKVLGEYVKHHVKEEEGPIFRAVRRAGLNLQELGRKISERKQRLSGNA